MSLLPKFYPSHAIGSKVQHPNVVDLYLDYACCYSAKLYKNWYHNVFPNLKDKYKGEIQVIFRNYVQVWHPTSTALHESSLAVAQICPSIFFEYSYELFDKIENFYDTETVDLSRNEIYEKVYNITIAPKFSDKIAKDDFFSRVRIEKSEKPANCGNKVTNDLKFFTRVGRQNGIHVTPTIVINGFKDGSIESSTSIETVDAKLLALL